MYEIFNSSFPILRNEIAKNCYSSITKSWVQNELLKPHIELERDKYFHPSHHQLVGENNLVCYWQNSKAENFENWERFA